MTKESPNFFIVGAAKSGTTALWAALKTHPSVFLLGDDIYNKEPCFFVKHYNEESLNNYLSLFLNSGQSRVVGEASTAYLSTTISAKIIHDFNPNSKILITLRNPAHRAYSLYNWMVQEGYEWIYPFERALLSENNRKEKLIPSFFKRAYYTDYLYFSSGLYYKQVKGFMDLFGENVKVIIFEELIANPEKILDECMNFLQVEPVPLLLGRDNPSVDVWSPKLQWVLRILDVLKLKVNQRLPYDYFVIKGRKAKRPFKIKQVTKLELMTAYEGDIKSLEMLIGKDLNCWRN